jgi:hypothetical protein
VTAVTRRALDRFLELGICAERVMTENAWASTHNQSLRQLFRARQTHHLPPAPDTPRTNPKVKRYNRPCNANGPTPMAEKTIAPETAAR